MLAFYAFHRSAKQKYESLYFKICTAHSLFAKALCST